MTSCNIYRNNQIIEPVYCLQKPERNKKQKNLLGGRTLALVPNQKAEHLFQITDVRIIN